MENQMTVDEQLDRMNEAEFKAFLEACTHKTKRTLEQAAMFSQLERPGKTPEEQIPPLTTTKHSSSLQSLSQSQGSNSRKNSQIHSASKSGSSSASSTSSSCGAVGGPSTTYPSNNNTHHHHHPPHLNSSFSSNNNYNSSSVHNTNWIVPGKTFHVQSTPPSSTGPTGDYPHHTLESSPNSQNPQQNVNCVTTVVNNSNHHLYNPPPSSSYYSSTPSSPSLNPEEDTATTSANSSSSSPNSGPSYSTTSFTATAPPSSRAYRYHSHPLQNPTTTTTPSISTPTSSSSSISVNFNLKRPPPPKPVVQNHIEVTASATLPSPYFFNSRTADQEDDRNLHSFGATKKDGVVVPDDKPLTSTSFDERPAVLLNPTQVPGGNLQNYASIQSFAGSSDFGSYSRHRISPRDSRSGTPVHGETAQASLNLTRRVGSHGLRNKKPKETILSASERPPYIGDRYENIEDLVSFITGEPEKAAQSTSKKPKKKGKRKETLSKSHSLDENTLGTDINPAIETRSVSSTLLEKTDESSSAVSTNTTEGLDLSPPTYKLESLRNHSSTEFITVTNRKKNKGQKAADPNKSKSESGTKEELSVRSEAFPKVEVEPLPRPVEVEPLPKPELIQPLKEETPPKEIQTVPKCEPMLKPEPLPHKEPLAKPEVTKAKVPPVRGESNVGLTSKAEPPPPEVVPLSNSKDVPYPRQENLRRQEMPMRRHQEAPQQFGRKYQDPPRRQDSGGGRRPLDPPARRQDQGRRKEREEFPQLQHHEPMQRRPLTRYDSEPRQFPARYREPVSKSASLSSESMPEAASSAVKSEDAVKFCGVNFDNKPEMLNQPNVMVEFGFGVTDVLSQLAIASPVEGEPPCNVQASPKKPPPGEDARSSSPPSFDRGPPQAFVVGEMQSGRIVEQVPQHMKLVTQIGDASLLGRHPQSGQSPPIHYLPMSVPLPMTGTGYQMPAQNYYQTLQQQVPVGVMQYFPVPHISTIQQMSAPIMTAIPAQGAANIQPQFINPLALTPQQQHQLIHHQHQFLQQQQQQQQHPPVLQHALQQQQQQQQQVQLQYHPVLVKTSPQQQQQQQQQSQFTVNQQNLPQFAQIPNAVQQHSQQGYNSQPHSGNYSYHHRGNGQRANQNLMNCSPQMSNYGISPQQQQYVGPSPQSFIGQNSTPQQHYHSQGGQSGGGHYNNYHRNNSRNITQNLGSTNYGGGGPQSSPQPTHGPGNDKSHRYSTGSNQNQNMRSQPTHLTRVSPAVANPPSPAEAEPTTPLVPEDGFVVIHPETNPLSNYYTPPEENEDNEKYAREGQEYMNQYVEKLKKRIEKGATIHRI